jgi:hypothetical protein
VRFSDDLIFSTTNLILDRTHRERKELYIRALEQEILNLRETFTSTVRQRDSYADENRKLKDILAANGIACDPSSASYAKPTSYAGSPVESYSGAYMPASATSSLASPTTPVYTSHPVSGIHTLGPHQPRQPGLDYDHIGVDFVLTYDRTPYLSPPPNH